MADERRDEGESLPPRENLLADGGEGSGSDRESRRALPDGGSAAGADDVALDPWGSASVADYRKLFEQFGIEEFDAVLPEVPNPHYLMRRGVIFGHRDYGPVAEAMRNDDPFAVLSGWMPTGDPHIGHKLMIDEIVYHQEQGGEAYALVADLEAHAARGMTWAEIDANTEEYLLSLLALGFDPEEGEIYRQSGNRRLQNLAFELGAEANFSEMQALYGFDGETNVSHMQSVITQMADILYPQLDEPMPTVIPVGPDQDPHVRLARDLAERMRYFKVTEAYASFEAEPEERVLVREAYDALGGDDADVRCEEAADYLREHHAGEAGASVVDKLDNAGKEPVRPRVRFLDRRATDAAFDALIEAVEGEKRVFEGHVDSFDLSRDAAEELAREVELDHGGHAFRAPSSVYHRFMTGLTGGKMSSSVPASHISLLDDPEEGYDKVKSATTGGRSTAEEQRELGGEADECPVYELYAYLLAGDDDEFATEVYEECVGGERLCGGCKEQAAEMMREFLDEHQEKREEMRPVLDELDIDVESPRRRD
ncbi:tryptophan--tRNA ligase [Halosegnis marinus]|uniref:Tryptophan--tRNA ligase n=1 Tax=Halosegnis marinus TaxID=3034023 RepID=A0ABD5ZP33_9EURY|nr:tryptophan--tRNA ligase [Halosegnis sp. DT85]